jgi:hypothetical protein
MTHYFPDVFACRHELDSVFKSGSGESSRERMECGNGAASGTAGAEQEVSHVSEENEDEDNSEDFDSAAQLSEPKCTRQPLKKGKKVIPHYIPGYKIVHTQLPSPSLPSYPTW